MKSFLLIIFSTVFIASCETTSTDAELGGGERVGVGIGDGTDSSTTPASEPESE
jgi:hypothetical protein